MRLVQQSNSWDCGAACLAMVLNKPIQAIHHLLGRDCKQPMEQLNGDHLGVHLDELCFILWLHGRLHCCFYPKESFTAPDSRAVCYERIRMMTLQQVNEQVRVHGGTAILGIPSPRGGHWIVVDQETIYDPKLTEPKHWDEDKQLEIQCALVIGPHLFHFQP